MKLNSKAFSLAAGIVWGIVVFLATNISMLRHGQGQTLSKLVQIYPGYSFSFGGSIVGLIWGFVSMALLGWLFAWLYNMFVTEK
jgi:hypothetical protein